MIQKQQAPAMISMFNSTSELNQEKLSAFNSYDDDDASFSQFAHRVSDENQWLDLLQVEWWAVIASSTLALGMLLFPVMVLQLKKTKRFRELLPKLPPPMRPPNSGKSYMEQFMLFWKVKKALGCPLSLWFLASASVQGGILWFQNLCESPNAVLGPIFPLLIAATLYISIQMSFPNSKARKETRLIGKLAKGSFNLLAH